jgi:hypothetical protein
MKTLKEIRLSQSVSQTDLAYRLQQIRGGKAFQSPISAIEKNKNSPTVSRLHDTLKALGFSLKVVAIKDGVEVELDIPSLLGAPSEAMKGGSV